MPKGHRVFAAIWGRATAHEDRRMRALRTEVASGVSGRVLEIGVGTGANWTYLPEGIEYSGIEPDDYMRARAITRAQMDGVDDRFEATAASAEALPFPDASFDTILVTFTLCSVDDPARALAEASRVLKPGGSIHYAEHVRPEGAAGSVLSAITPLWSRVSGNCHPNRRTGRTLREAGFEVVRERNFKLAGLPAIVGVARKPGV